MAYTKNSAIDETIIAFESMVHKLESLEEYNLARNIRSLLTVAKTLEGTENEYMIHQLYESAQYTRGISKTLGAISMMLDKELKAKLDDSIK